MALLNTFAQQVNYTPLELQGLELDKPDLPILMDASSKNPLGILADLEKQFPGQSAYIIPWGTPVAVCSAATNGEKTANPGIEAKWKPISMTLADGAATTTGNKVIPVAETTMFAVGDRVGVAAQATPYAALTLCGTIASISNGVSITLAADNAQAVVSGDIVGTMINDPCAVLHSGYLYKGNMGTNMEMRWFINSSTASIGTADLPASMVYHGLISESNIWLNTARGITIARLAHAIPDVTIRPNVWGELGGVIPGY